MTVGQKDNRTYNARDKFTLDSTGIEWLLDEEARAYEKWLDNTPEVSSTEGVAPEFELPEAKPHKPRKARKKKTT